MTTPTNNVIPFPGTPPAPAPLDDSDESDFAWKAKRVWNVRYIKGLNKEQKNRCIFNFVWNYENSKTTARSAWLRTRDGSNAYFYDGHHYRLYNLDIKDADFTGYLFNNYGLNHVDEGTKFLVAALKNATMSTGLVRDIRRFTYWDRATRTLYVSGYDGTCYRINGHQDVFEGVRTVPNGTGPAIFRDDDKGVAVGGDEVVQVDEDGVVGNIPGPLLGNHRRLFNELVEDLQYAPSTSGSMSPATQKMCLTIWIFALAFPDLMPTKPLLLVEGSPGAGKTLALQRIALALHGKIMPIQIPKQEDKDLGVKILRSPIAIIDDINELVEWVRDALCTYATGGGWSRRTLYTNDGEHVIKPESFLSITTNNPVTFKQGQLADRCLVLRLERRQDKGGFMNAEALFDRVRYYRDEIFGEWLSWLNEIVAELRLNPVPTISRTRMADFAHIAHVIARVLARPGGPSGDWSEDAVNKMLDAMQEERDALIMDAEDPIVDLLDKWLDTASNQGRRVRVSDLHSDLSALARANNHTWFYKSSRALAARLRETSDALAHHFTITRETGANNVLIYSFERL